MVLASNLISKPPSHWPHLCGCAQIVAQPISSLEVIAFKNMFALRVVVAISFFFIMLKVAELQPGLLVVKVDKFKSVHHNNIVNTLIFGISHGSPLVVWIWPQFITIPGGTLGDTA